VKIFGRLSITLAVFALIPSLVPGAMSLLAFYLSLAALVISITSIKSAGTFYFRTTAIIVCIGMLIVNDYLRLYGSLPQSTWEEKLGLYAVYTAICVAGAFKLKKS